MFVLGLAIKCRPCTDIEPRIDVIQLQTKTCTYIFKV